MIPIDFEQSKIKIKSRKIIQGEIIEVPVFYNNPSDESNTYITCWKASFEELQEIKKTGKIWLKVHGKFMDNTELLAFNPFAKPENVNP